MLKETAIRLRQHGYSYSEIAQKIGKTKKFAFYHTKDVPFSSEGEKRYRRQVTGIVKQIKTQKYILEPAKARIIGHILFDGMLYHNKYHYLAKYVNSSKKLIDQFIKDVREVYGLKTAYIETLNGEFMITYKVYFKSKQLYLDLKKYFESYSTTNKSIAIPAKILNAEKRVKIEFLRAFFEDEGSISANGRIMGDLKSEKIINRILRMLREFGLFFKICEYKSYTGIFYKIYLSKTKENLVLFDKLNLFGKSIITHGKNKGKFKVQVLKEQIEKLKNH